MLFICFDKGLFANIEIFQIGDDSILANGITNFNETMLSLVICDQLRVAPVRRERRRSLTKPTKKLTF